MKVSLMTVQWKLGKFLKQHTLCSTEQNLQCFIPLFLVNRFCKELKIFWCYGENFENQYCTVMFLSSLILWTGTCSNIALHWYVC